MIGTSIFECTTAISAKPGVGRLCPTFAAALRSPLLRSPTTKSVQNVKTLMMFGNILACARLGLLSVGCLVILLSYYIVVECTM